MTKYKVPWYHLIPRNSNFSTTEHIFFVKSVQFHIQRVVRCVKYGREAWAHHGDDASDMKLKTDLLSIASLSRFVTSFQGNIRTSHELSHGTIDLLRIKRETT